MRAAREPEHTKEHGQVCAPLRDWACQPCPPFPWGCPADFLTASPGGWHPSKRTGYRRDHLQGGHSDRPATRGSCMPEIAGVVDYR